MAKPLPSKEQTLFRQVVQGYENKQYKKGLKSAEQILKKHPDHGDTIAMKALIINSQGKRDEAFELAKVALKHSMKSHVCWHVYGLLWRSIKNYDEAIKAYKFALRLEPDSQQIQRDLALLQVHMRDYPGFAQSRKVMLQQRPGFRQNWTAMAIAHHLSGDLQSAENVLTTFEGTLKSVPPKSDMEHAGAVLYKNLIIAETGDTQKALDHLNTIYRNHPDRTAVMELKAKYLLELGKKEDAERAYRKLLGRNPDKRAYYEGLECSLGLARENPEDASKLVDLYSSYADKYARVDAPRRIPLDFLAGGDFRKAAEAYLKRMLSKGVPSTFANVKSLYGDKDKKQVIEELVLGFESQKDSDSQATTNGNKPDQFKISVLYFLAQHYNYHLSRDLDKASSYINQCLELNTSAIEYSYKMTQARIIKHKGDVKQASQLMNAARELDLKDRYINTKSAKYQLRNDQNQDAIATMGLFTRKEAVGGPLGDLLDMQCMWFLFEDGQSWLRQDNLALAFKRFRSIYEIFEQWTEDQFDFHSFSLRKGQIAAYIEMLHWEDALHSHPFYTRAALSAIDILLKLHDNPDLAAKHAGELPNGASDAQKKKAAKKAKKEAEKAEEEKKAAEAAKANASSKDEGETKKADTDPTGATKLKEAIEQGPATVAMEYLRPMLMTATDDVRVQEKGFEVYFRREKYLAALKCLLAANKLGLDRDKVKHAKERLEKASSSASDSALQAKAADVLKEGLAGLKL